MHEELVNRLRELPHLLFVQLHGHEDVVYEAAEAIEELQQTFSRYEDCFDYLYKQACDYKAMLPRWIPVTERLPEDLTRVIVFCEDGVSYGLCEHLIADDEEVVEWHDFLHYPITPTHWMPLPEPPKEEA